LFDDPSIGGGNNSSIGGMFGADGAKWADSILGVFGGSSGSARPVGQPGPGWRATRGGLISHQDSSWAQPASSLPCYHRTMKAIRVRVENGQITGTAPPGLPDGEVDLCLAEPEDDLSNEELGRLNAALARGFESIQAGRFRSAVDVLSDLRRR